ncbi:hypothetical protein Tco_0186300 [Tanacetum coccineum]
MSSSAIPIPADLAPAPRIIPRELSSSSSESSSESSSASFKTSPPSSSVRPSRKRYRSPTTSPPAATLEDTIEAIVEVATEPVIPPIHPEQTIDGIEQELQTLRDRVAASEGEKTTLHERRCKTPYHFHHKQSSTSITVLSSYSAEPPPIHRVEAFRGSPAASLQEDTIEATWLEIPLPKIDGIEQELQTLRDRVAASEGEKTTLHERVRVMELGDESLRVLLRTVRTEQAEMQQQARDTAEELRQSQIARFHDRERIRRIKAYLCRYFDYHMEFRLYYDLLHRLVFNDSS